MTSLLAELRRRNVFKVCLAYLAIAWLLLQVADTVFPVFQVPDWALRVLIIVFALGLPVAAVMAWIFELTPHGVMKTNEISVAQRSGWNKSRKLDFAIITLLSLALVVVIIDQYVIEPMSQPKVSRLAVLPLSNQSGDPEQQYFVDGMTDALITNLAKFSALRVIPRTSVMRFAGSERSLLAIAAELGVDAIVTGSAQRDGIKFRILVQLTDAANDELIWGNAVESDFDKVLEVQSELAQAIADESYVAVTSQERSRLTSAGAASADGYDDYLRGMQFFYRLTPADLDTALQYFDLALEKNPNSPLSHSGVAATWIGLQQMGFVKSGEATPRAEAAALRALDLDSELAQPHLWLAIVRAWGDWNWGEAEQLYLRAIELNPSYADARGSYGHLLAVNGRFDEAINQIETGIENDPFNPWIIGIYGVVFHMMGRYEEAIEAFQKALRIAPDLPFAWLVLAGSYHMSGQFDHAIAAEGSLLAALGDDISQRKLLQIYRDRGYQEAMNWIARQSAEYSVAQGTLGWWAAFRYAHAGMDDLVIAWLETAHEQRDPNLPFFLVPEFESVRDHPKFQALVQKVGLLNN